MIDGKLSFGKFDISEETIYSEFLYMLEERKIEYSCLEKDKFKHSVRIDKPLLINNMLCSSCEVFFYIETIDKIEFVAVEIGKETVDDLVKRLNKSFHINISSCSRADFPSEKSVYQTPIGTLSIDRKENGDEVNFQITIYPLKLLSGDKNRKKGSMGPNIISEGVVFVNFVEVNPNIPINTIIELLKGNSYHIIYELKSEECFALPRRNKTLGLVKIDECAWMDEIFRCEMHYSQKNDKVTDIWLYKNTKDRGESMKIYEKFVSLIEKEEGIQEYFGERPAYLARRFTSTKIDNLMIEIGYHDTLVRVAFLYNYVA